MLDGRRLVVILAAAALGAPAVVPATATARDCGRAHFAASDGHRLPREAHREWGELHGGQGGLQYGLRHTDGNSPAGPKGWTCARPTASNPAYRSRCEGRGGRGRASVRLPRGSRVVSNRRMTGGQAAQLTQTARRSDESGIGDGQQDLLDLAGLALRHGVHRLAHVRRGPDSEGGASHSAGQFAAGASQRSVDCGGHGPHNRSMIG